MVQCSLCVGIDSDMHSAVATRNLCTSQITMFLMGVKLIFQNTLCGRLSRDMDLLDCSLLYLPTYS